MEIENNKNKKISLFCIITPIIIIMNALYDIYLNINYRSNFHFTYLAIALIVIYVQNLTSNIKGEEVKEEGEEDKSFNLFKSIVYIISLIVLNLFAYFILHSPHMPGDLNIFSTTPHSLDITRQTLIYRSFAIIFSITSGLTTLYFITGMYLKVQILIQIIKMNSLKKTIEKQKKIIEANNLKFDNLENITPILNKFKRN